MQVRLIEGERPELRVAASADWSLFDRVAVLLESATGGSWVERLDGLDQRYWDLQAGQAHVTLHLEHFAGITLFPAHGSPDVPASCALVRRAAALLNAHDLSA